MHRKAFISPTLALTIEEVTGIPAQMLLGLDTAYHQAHTTKPTPKDKADDSKYLNPYD